MKRKYLLAVLIAAAMPLTSMAQDDDLYFNPKKEAKEKAERRALLQRQYAEQRARRDSVYRLFWSGSDRSVDEYNRGGRIFSHYENVGKDSLGNDIISSMWARVWRQTAFMMMLTSPRSMLTGMKISYAHAR